jgi:aspartate/methionine/tyrosine aminotransferase
MKIEPHLLDQWLQSHAAQAEFDLGASTGPQWTVRELLTLADESAIERLLNTKLAYSHTAGATPLREAIAEMQGVPVEHVLVLGGAAEALLHTFWLAAEPGANVVVPFPCFPPHRTLPQGLGLQVRSFQLRRENGYRIDLDDVRRLIDNRPASCSSATRSIIPSTTGQRRLRRRA